jgi:hypothetical protein
MADETAQIIRLAAWLGRALGSADALFADFDTEQLGLTLPPAVLGDATVVSQAEQCAAKSAVLRDRSDSLAASATTGDEVAMLAAFVRLGAALGEFAVALNDLVTSVLAAISPATVPDPAERAGAEDFAAGLAKIMSDYAIGAAITDEIPTLGVILRLLGLLDWSEAYADPANPLSRRHVRRRLQLERFQGLVNDPEAHLRDTLGWGAADFDPLDLFTLITDLFPDESDVSAGLDGGEPFLQLGAFRLQRDPATVPPGLDLLFLGRLGVALDQRFDVFDDWDIVLTASMRLLGRIGGAVTPPLTVRLIPPSEIGGDIRLFIERRIDARPFDLIAGNGLVTMSVDNLGLGVGLEAAWNPADGAASINPLLFADLAKLTLKLGSDDADSFIGSLLSGAEINGEFDLGLEWSGDLGMRVTASGGIEIALPIHKNLGPVTLDTIYLSLRIHADGTLALETSAALTGTIGPLSAAVDRIGAQLDIRFATGADAAFGPFDLALGFKPPNGIGLAVDAGVVKGGGYLYIDAERGEYAGALELVFSGFLTLTAVGIITTKNPDGTPGFSLLVIITAQFGTPFQLGFGFVLVGVGGLLGLNRSMNLDALAEGVRSGAITAVMFPENIVENAPRIISDLRRFFPAHEGTFLIGPMVKLGWGTPPLITASIGIIIEIPGNIAIVGVLRVVLPTEEASILRLQVNLIGAIEFDKQRLWFFAALYESRVLFITLEGEMGLLVAWGSDANFVLSVGGFHPQFSPPPLPFPSPRRLAFSILDESWGRIRVSGYFAVTSNTVQLGASVELFFGLDEVSVSGHLGFDALFQFNPFYFILEISAGVDLKVFGIGLFSISLKLALQGPAPWHAKGYGKLSLLFFSIKANFDFTWGEQQDSGLPPIAVLPPLAAELANPGNWKAIAPGANSLLVTLRPLPESAALVLHPLGSLHVSQRYVPLSITLDKVGTQKPSDGTKFEVTVLGGLARVDDAEEPFAIVQYQNFTDAQKLSKPAFENQRSGLQLAPAGATMATGRAVERHVRYETVILDSNRPRVVIALYAFIQSLFRHFLSGASVARSPLSQQIKTQLDPYTEKIVVGKGAFVVASTMDNTPIHRDAVFPSAARAEEHLAAQLAADPGLSGNAHVIPASEMAVAA